MKRMLFNATQAEELRVAIVDGQKLIDLDIESATKEQRKSNIYKAVITRIEPSLEACFVDYGTERHGFLPFKEVSRSYFKSDVEPNRARVQDALHVGQELIVQVDKDERGNKGAALTTFISLAGRYLVLMPNNPRGGGVSRRVEGEDRAELRDIMDQLDMPQGMSLIARTAGIGRTLEELQWDLNYLMQLWRAIENAATSQTGAFLIYQEGSLVIRAIRDYFQPDIGEILIDTDTIYEQAKQFMGHVMPGNVSCVKRYSDDVPLFSRFQIEHQIESAYSRQVGLPSGGAIVIDHTEALVAVDVNSGRATRGADIEETAFKTNLEAADEIARQLRLRDLGGLIVIDFIDMEAQRNQREVENRLRDALHYDRARVQTGKISRFGLLELSRQRLRPTLAETSYIPCPRCTGTGHIRSTESAALHILRILEEEAMKENTGALHTQVPVDVATFLLNEKRAEIHAIELRHKVNIVLIPNIHLETPAHEIVRLRHDQLNLEETALPSYRMVEAPPEEGYQPRGTQPESKPQRLEAAVKGITPEQPAPIVEPKPEPAAMPAVTPPPRKTGFMQKLMSWFRGEPEAAPAPEPERPARREAARDTAREGGREIRRGGRGRREGAQRPERGERHERPERQERPERAETRPQPPRAEGGEAQREPRRGKSDRGEPRPPRPPRAAPTPQIAETARAETAAAPAGVLESQSTAAPADSAAESGQRSRRGRRGGRRGQGERRAEETGASVQPALAETAPVPAETSAPVSGATDTLAATQVEPASQREPVAVESAHSEPLPPVVVERPTAAEPVGVAVTQPVAEALPPLVASPAEPVAPVVAAPPAAEPLAAVVQEPAVTAPAPAPAPITEPVDIAAALQQSGLVMVETDRQKVQSWQPELPVQPAEPQPRRRHHPAPPPSNEPLVQIETRK